MEDETINYLLVTYVFGWEFWFLWLRQIGLQILAPHPEAQSFMEWWRGASAAVEDQASRGLYSLIILGAWNLWNHRNRCVFDGRPPSIATALVQVGVEQLIWEMAGAKGISLLTEPHYRKIRRCCGRVEVLYVKVVTVTKT